jgi:hypothetical protein
VSVPGVSAGVGELGTTNSIASKICHKGKIPHPHDLLIRINNLGDFYHVPWQVLPFIFIYPNIYGRGNSNFFLAIEYPKAAEKKGRWVDFLCCSPHYLPNKANHGNGKDKSPDQFLHPAGMHEKPP